MSRFQRDDSSHPLCHVTNVTGELPPPVEFAITILIQRKYVGCTFARVPERTLRVGLRTHLFLTMKPHPHILPFSLSYNQLYLPRRALGTLSFITFLRDLCGLRGSLFRKLLFEYLAEAKYLSNLGIDGWHHSNRAPQTLFLPLLPMHHILQRHSSTLFGRGG